MAISLAPLFMALSVTAPAANPAEFTAAPTVKRGGNGAVITFALRESSDVEVAILNANGRVVRHLAAGVLGGKNAPPAPLKPGLAQELTWDGKDDRGKVAEGGPFQARVRAGMSVQFGRLIGGSPYTGKLSAGSYRAASNGIVADADGNLFALVVSSVGSHGNSGLWPWHLRKFDREGTYQKTLLPYPPSTKPDAASGFTLLPTPEGRFTPANHTSLYPVFAALGNAVAPRLVDGRVVFVYSEQRRLNFLALDGSNRLTSVPMWPERAKLKCPTWLTIQVAFAPDGKHAYYSNVAASVYDGKKPSDIDPAWPQGRVYRHDLTKDGAMPEPFYDLTLPDWEKDKYWMPSAWDMKTAAAGIDTDAAGHLYVCDLVNHQVVEVDPAGKQRSAFKIAWPDLVLAARKSSDFYVITRKVSRGAAPPATLHKITGRGAAARVVAELPLTGTIGSSCTLDESGKTPVLWLAGQNEETGKLLRVEDRGAELVVTGDNYLNRDPNAITFVGYMDVDREAELVYVTRSGGTVWRFHGETGAGGPLSIKAVDLAVGPGGQVYTWGTSGSYQGPIARYTRDLKPAPLAATGLHTFGNLYGRAGRGSSVCGMDVDAQGRVYATFGSNECHVRVYDDKGELVEYPRRYKNVPEGVRQEIPVAIRGVSGYGGSLRVDAAGNLYLLQQREAKDRATPPGYEKDEAYARAVGTIYKFPPTGGEVHSANNSLKGVTGAIARYTDCGPASQWNAVGSCVCTKPRFDVDDYGRLYIPNGITFTVSVRDNADNEIVRFGDYGNYDCQGPLSAEPKPAIPLGWPVAVGASDRYLYVGDCLNHRVVRVDRRFAVEKVMAVP